MGRLIKLIASAILGLTVSLSPIHAQDNEGRKPSSYSAFTPKLEELLNKGDVKEAGEHLQSSNKTEVPLKEAIFFRLRKDFNHDYEKGYLLFSDKEGIIDTMQFPAQFHKEYSNDKTYEFYFGLSLDLEDCRKIIVSEGHRNRSFIGVYHTHPSRKEFIITERGLKLSKNRIIIEDSDEPNLPYPNLIDIRKDFYCIISKQHDKSNCKLISGEFSKIKPPKTTLEFIGGLGNPDLCFKIRAYAIIGKAETVPGLDLSRLNLSGIGAMSWEKFQKEYNKEHNQQLEYVELSLKQVR